MDKIGAWCNLECLGLRLNADESRVALVRGHIYVEDIWSKTIPRNLLQETNRNIYEGENATSRECYGKGSNEKTKIAREYLRIR